MSREPLDPTTGVLCPSCGEVVLLPHPAYLTTFRVEWHPVLGAQVVDGPDTAMCQCNDCGCGTWIYAKEHSRFRDPVKVDSIELEAIWRVTAWAPDEFANAAAAKAAFDAKQPPWTFITR